MYFHKYSKYKPYKTSICENYIKPVEIFGDHISKCPDTRRKRRPISLHRVPPCRISKVKTNSSSVGSPCIFEETHARACTSGSFLYVCTQILPKKDLAIRYYLMNLSINFHKDSSFCCRDRDICKILVLII